MSARPIPVRRTRRVVAVAFGVLAGLTVALVVLAFLWPIATSDAHDLPVAVVGGQLRAGDDLPVDATSYGSRAEAVRSIQRHETDGAFILGPGGPEVLVAGADGAATVSLLEGVGDELASA